MTGNNIVHDELNYPPLTFPSIPRGAKQTVPGLKRLLYRGGASTNARKVDHSIQQGLLGDILSERIKLVHKIHAYIDGLLAGGGSNVTAEQQIKCIGIFFDWADQSGASLNELDVQESYLNWAESLVHRVRVVRNLKALSACTYARLAGQVLDGALDRITPLVQHTRLPKLIKRNKMQGTKADKQLLSETFAFGNLLQDICDGLNLKVVWGPRPVYILLQAGGQIEVCATNRQSKSERNSYNVRMSAEAALAYENDRSLDNYIRRNLVNLRIQAELLMFIGQTGMNLAQAQSLQLRSFSYSSDIDGYKVKEYKPRRQGEVLFDIFSEYRSHFERYLEWRRKIFPKSNQRLFPIVRREGTLDNQWHAFGSIKTACKNAGVPWIPAGSLRGIRVNWLLRRSGDPDLTAEVSQHHKHTLLQVYEKPSLQVALNEITRFHLNHDPMLLGHRPLLSVAPGECMGSPVVSVAKPEQAPAPDCILPSGCLWCEHHRDVDSIDYVWSMASFRYLKLLELSRHCLPVKNQKYPHPVEYTIKKLSEKLSWFRESNAKRREWVEEVLARIQEEDFHDQWSYLIDAIEGPAK